jgi:hypothetical protein
MVRGDRHNSERFDVNIKFSWLILAALVAIPQSVRAGTVAHYRFESGSATIATDETGINHGSINGGASLSASVGQNPLSGTGQPNAQSLSLSGTGQYVSVPNNSSLSFGASPWTIEAYINLNSLPTTLTSGQYLAQKKAAAIDDFQDYSFLVGGNRAGLAGSLGKTTSITGTELRVELGNGTGLTGITSNLQVPAAGSWIFVSAAYDGGTSLRFTLDDNLSDAIPGLVDTILLPPITNLTNNGDLFIGAKRNNMGVAAQLFGGKIDEVRISNVVVPVGSLLAAPVPEPSTWVLAVLAAASVAMVRRRKSA